MEDGGVVRFMEGNEAVVEGAVAAGVRFFAGYPITPATEIAEHMSIRMPQVGGTFMQMEDELASLAAVIGASVGGVKSMDATSGPGISLKNENIGFAVAAEIPCVIINVQRTGPGIGSVTMAQQDLMQARWGSHGDYTVIALAPASVQECYDLTIRAVNLSERFRTPVILLLDTFLGHLSERVVLETPKEIIDRPRPTVPPEKYLTFDAEGDEIPRMADFGGPYRSKIIGNMHNKAGGYTRSPEIFEALIRRWQGKVLARRNEYTDVERFMIEDARVAVITWGTTARSAKRAIRIAREEGIPVGLFRPRTVWPFPGREVEDLSGRVGQIVVPEMNLGQMYIEVDRWSRGRCGVHPVNQVDGQAILPARILEKIKEVA
ncbi:MAG: 2-oxoacid:acceptor oxidoreductase subunit alpha [Deltaproteobacteria bacterium]|nr:2-oxoacid:acceptor oxidoreductase subunit alpha [Deltaproteobacteria bacterium]MBW2305663.1 2-oxoacid:acceptor oxidoreductase subunit alpha [Deltaproteobacteria bacterium]